MDRSRPRRGDGVDPTVGQLHRLPSPHHPTKTRTPRRAIDLAQRTVVVLRLPRSSTCRAREGRSRSDRSPAPTAKRFTRTQCRRPVNRLQRAAGVPAIRLHDLRHTHATLLLKHGIPLKVVTNASATRHRRSRWPSTSTCCPVCNAMPPTRSPPHHTLRFRRRNRVMSVAGR